MSIPHRCMALVAVGLAATAVAQTGWTQRLPVTQPPVRSSHALTYDLLRATTVMFGGLNGTALADTWEWAGVNWTLRATSNSPPARWCHALATDLFRGRVVLFGGTSDGTTEWNDTWEYDGLDWVLRQPLHMPSARRNVGMEYDAARTRVVLFGGGVGYSGVPVFADTWSWDGSDWTLRNPATSPPARHAHSMTSDYARGRIILFGGSAAGNTSTLADTWTWDGTDWTEVLMAFPPPPTTRAGCAYDANRDFVVVYGGGQPNRRDTWLFDSTSWRRDPRAIAPPARSWCPLAHDLLRGRTVLFGGYGFVHQGDTWEYDSGSVARWTPFGGTCYGALGVPSLQAGSSSLPILGTTLVLRVHGVPGNAAAVSIGFSDQQWGGHTLPWNLGALGMPGCTLHVSPDFLFFAPVNAGMATLSWPLPNDAGLTGTRFFNQAFVLAPGANPMGAVVSNAGVGLIGSF